MWSGCRHSPDALVFVNGERIEESIELHTSDRIILGNQSVFRFVNPKEDPPAENQGRVIDWDFAQQEMRKEEAAMKEKIRAMNDEFKAIYDDVRENCVGAKTVPPHSDPFYHLVRLIGEATVGARDLASGALKEKKIELKNPLKNRVQGMIVLDFESNIPLHEGGFAGRDISFTLHIRSLESVHRKLSERTFVQYQTMFDQDLVSTDVVSQSKDAASISYNWKKGYYVPAMLVDDDESQFFSGGTITFSVYGYVGEDHKKRIS